MKDTSVPNIPEKILEKIKKLHNMAISKKEIGSLQEAEVFLLGVQKFLSEYNLEMSVLDKIGEKSNIIESNIYYKGLVSYGNWEVDLMNSICQYNWCKLLFNSHTKKMTLIGRGDNVDVCTYLYNFISINLIALSKKSLYTTIEFYAKQLGKPHDMSNTEFEKYLNENKYMPYRRYYIRDYLAGAVVGINHKFAAQQAETSKEANVSGLILINTDKIDNYLAEFYPDLTTAKEKKTKRGMGYTQGRNDGFNLKIGERIEAAEKIKGVLENKSEKYQCINIFKVKENCNTKYFRRLFLKAKLVMYLAILVLFWKTA